MGVEWLVCSVSPCQASIRTIPLPLDSGGAKTLTCLRNCVGLLDGRSRGELEDVRGSWV